MRGRPFQPGNKFGRGRPKGSRNKQTLELQKLIDEHGPKLLGKAMAEAAKGDASLLRLFAKHALDRTKDHLRPIGPLATGTIQEVTKSQQIIIDDVISGALTHFQGMRMLEMVEHRRKAIETQDLAERMDALEGHTKKILGRTD
ncbi:MAG TPA: hypothetical protein VH639_05630 [Bryobacteraceae bacterium]|jgi:hypothetical protein